MIVCNDLARDPGNDRGFASPTFLVLGEEPVPAQRRVCGFGLARIGDYKFVLLSEIIHTGPSCEVVSMLGATMQHHKQRRSALLEATRNVELVVSATGRAGKGPAQELSPVRNLDNLAWPGIRQRIETEVWKLTAGARLLPLSHHTRPRPGSRRVGYI